MNCAIRVDASIAIGTGHVIRCLTLADALVRRGVTCRFVSRDHPGNLNALISARGHAVTSLPFDGAIADHSASHGDWLGATWEADVEATLSAIDGEVDWIVVDHYALDARWESAAHARCGRLLAIDDLADRPHSCDFLVDQTLGRDAADYSMLTPDGSVILAGSEYGLLRPEFSAARADSLARRGRTAPRSLLVTMGGVDQADATGRVLDTLAANSLSPGTTIAVVMGPHAPWLDQVRARAAAMPVETQVLVGVADMAALMSVSDIAIGAAGTTAWERCCVGLPTITVVLADNQRDGAAALAHVGAAEVIDVGAIDIQLPVALDRLRDPAKLAAMSRAAAAVTDGRGTARVVAEMIGD